MADLDELEMHLAAGTDLPTALAAMPKDRPPATDNRAWAWQLGLLIGLGAGILALILLS